MQNENIIEFQNVSYRYEADDGEEKLPLVVNNISLNFKKGDFIAILGHNGSGKSTLAKLSNSILIPESGKVLVNGMDTADEDLSYDIRRTVGVVFQNPDNQIVATIVEEDVAFGPENLGVPPEEIRKRVEYFAKAEERAILSLDIKGTVIATGGSVVYSDKAMEHLKSLGKIIYLHLSYEDMCKRISNLETRDTCSARKPLCSSCRAGITTEKNYSVAKIRAFITWNKLFQFKFYLLWVLCINNPQTI